MRPGETVKVDESRAKVLRNLYSWQFEIREAQEGGNAPSFQEVEQQTKEYQNPVLETRDAGQLPQEELRTASSGGNEQVEADPNATPVKEEPKKSPRARK